MNFLAHIALSGENPEVIMGNFCGDYIKGKLDSEKNSVWPDRFLRGVRLHRFIDNFTDTDRALKEMIREIAVFYGRAAPVAADVCFDHFLAVNFRRFYDADLRHYISSFYRLADKYSYLIPPDMHPLASALVENDWLFKYREWETVERTLTSMSRRYSFLSDLSRPPELFRANRAGYERYFLEFYPRLREASRLFLEELPEPD